MTRLTLAQTQKTLSAAFRKVSRGRKPLIVTDGGKDLVAVISVRQLQRLMERQQDRSDAKEALRRLADRREKRIPFRQVARELGLD